MMSAGNLEQGSATDSDEADFDINSDSDSDLDSSGSFALPRPQDSVSANGYVSAEGCVSVDRCVTENGCNSSSMGAMDVEVLQLQLKYLLQHGDFIGDEEARRLLRGTLDESRKLRETLAVASQNGPV